MRYLRIHRRDSPMVLVGAIVGVAMALSAAAAGGANTPDPPAASAPSVKETKTSKRVDAAIKNGPAVVVGHLPSGVVDKIGLVEARAAANAQGATFVALDASNAEHAQELLTRFRVTSTPTVMIIMPKGKIRTQLTGYADRETVGQAIANAKQ